MENKNADIAADTKKPIKVYKKDLLLSILQEADRPLSKWDLAEKLHVSERVVREHIAELRNEGYPIVSSARRKGYWLTDDTEEIRHCIEEYYSRSARLRLTAEIMTRNLDVIKNQLKMEGEDVLL